MVDQNEISDCSPSHLTVTMEKTTKRASVFSLSRPKSTKTKKEIMYELNKKVVSVKEGSRLWGGGVILRKYPYSDTFFPEYWQSVGGGGGGKNPKLN